MGETSRVYRYPISTETYPELMVFSSNPALHVRRSHAPRPKEQVPRLRAKHRVRPNAAHLTLESIME